jgi:Rrf2 family iron-sulfur cluster assembly transcriptional regulator
MRLSTKGRFAVTAMIDVALREKTGPVSLSEIAARHQISLSYLEQMFSKLRQHQLVESTRGPGGGYTLGHRSDSITIADIISAIEDAADNRTLDATQRAKNTAPNLAQDMTQELWDDLQSKMADYMQSITLRRLVMEQLAKGFRVEERQSPNRGVFKKPKNELVRPSVPNSVFALGQSLLARG